MIKGKLIEGTYDELENAHLDAIVIDDGHGHRSEHVISRAEAAAIEEAIWSAGEDRTIDTLTGRILNELEDGGFDFHSPELPEVSLVRRSSA